MLTDAEREAPPLLRSMARTGTPLHCSSGSCSDYWGIFTHGAAGVSLLAEIVACIWSLYHGTLVAAQSWATRYRS